MWKRAFNKFEGIWSVSSRPYPFRIFEGCRPQILLGPFLNTLSDIILTECKQLPDFPVLSWSTLRKWCENFGFCYKLLNKKMQVYQKFGVNIVPVACNLMKSKTRTQVFFHEFCNLFQPVLLLKIRHQRRCFPVIMISFSACNFSKSETLAQVFSSEFWKIFKGTYFAVHLWRAASNDLVMARFVCKIHCLLKWKIKRYQM